MTSATPSGLSPDSTSQQTLAVARWCAAQGWPVHPLAMGRKTPAGNCPACRVHGHSPAGCPCLPAGRWCHGFLAATLDEDLIASWWGTHPQLGVGVACGPAGLVVLDIDAHPGAVPSRDRVLPGISIDDRVDLTGLATGFDSLALLAALRGAQDPAQDASTLRVRTPSGGLHVWYRSEADRWLCSVGSGTGTGRALAWQVDIRAAGGYIIAPGTRTRDGTYTMLGRCRQPAPLPAWLAQELGRTGHVRSPQAQAPSALSSPVPARARQAIINMGGGRSQAERALHTVLAEVVACAEVPAGAGFTAKLNRAAYTAGGLVASGYFTETEAERLLTEAAVHARPGQERRCSSIIRNGLVAGGKRPLQLKGRA